MWWSMLMSWALAAPVELPAGEDPADWAEVFTLVGLELTDEPAERGVRMEPVGDRWRVEVIGTGREALVAPPHTRSDREDIAQLAASLWAASADPGPLPSLPELPALPDPSVAPPPVVAPAPEPELVPVPPVPQPSVEPEEAPGPPAPVAEPTPAPSAAEPPPEPVPEPSPPSGPVADGPPAAPVVGPTASPRIGPDPLDIPPRGLVSEAPPGRLASHPPSPWRAWASLGLALRSTVRPSAALDAWGAAQLGPVLVGVGGLARSPSMLTRLTVERQTSDVGGAVGVWAAGRAGGMGLVAGGAARSFYEAGLQSTVGVPQVGASVWMAPFPAPVRVELRVTRDLRTVELYVDDVREQVYEPWGVSLSVGVLARPPARGRAKQRPRR